jgi:aminotransferase in exopolysaccharide biosynthesis
MEKKFQDIVSFIRKLYNKPEGFIPLHEPKFIGNERKYVLDAIDSTFVSSVGEYVNRFEKMMTEQCGTTYAVATVNGTAALHIALLLADVKPHDEVITQPLTFIATCNAISYIGAHPVFLDVDQDTMGLSPIALKSWLNENAHRQTSNAKPINKKTGKHISACIPMHTFGFPCRIDEIKAICDEWNIALIEDAAESIGSFYKGKHTGSFGLIGTFSFNGNKTITCGGGGAIVTNDESIAKRAKHLTTQAKVPHPWEFTHDAVGYNYRLPNLNAAMACAQLEVLNDFVAIKRENAEKYNNFFNEIKVPFVTEIEGAYSNYWLNCILMKDKFERDAFLEYANNNGVMTRPTWNLMNTLPMFEQCQTDELLNATNLSERLVNIPSSAIV